MHIEQIVIEFVSIEDRLLMTVHVDGPSIRVWLTRRYVRLLRSALNDILGHQVIASRPLAVGSNTLLAELMHEQAIANVDLSTPPISRHHSASAQADSDTELDSSHTVASGSTSGSSGTSAAAIAAEAKALVGDRPVYLTYDIDSLDPVYAPGTGTPEIGGMTTHQAQVLLRGLRGLNYVGADLVEVSPPFDTGYITSLAGAALAYEILCLLAESRSS